MIKYINFTNSLQSKVASVTINGSLATTLYGNAAASRVVLINTKKSKAEKKALTVTNNTIFATTERTPNRQNTPDDFDSWENKTRLRLKELLQHRLKRQHHLFLDGHRQEQTYASASTTHASRCVDMTEFYIYELNKP